MNEDKREEVGPSTASAVNADSGFPNEFPMVVHMDPLGAHFTLSVDTGQLMTLVSIMRGVNELTDEGKTEAARAIAKFFTTSQPTLTLRPYVKPEQSRVIQPGKGGAENLLRQMGTKP